jgi:hypothetical protein
MKNGILDYRIVGLLSRTECIGLVALAIRDFMDFPHIGHEVRLEQSDSN